MANETMCISTYIIVKAEGLNVFPKHLQIDTWTLRLYELFGNCREHITGHAD